MLRRSRLRGDGGGRSGRGPEAEAGQEIRSAVAAGEKKILLDMKGVPVLDSSGVGELMAAYTSVSRHGGTIKLLSGDTPQGSDRTWARVRFVGFVCVSESNKASGSEEPYFLVGVSGVNNSNTVRFGPYGDVDAGDLGIVLGTAVALTAVFMPLTTHLYRTRSV